MPVHWDAVLTREVARELDARLRGARLRAYRFDGPARRLTLFTDAGCLEWRLHPLEGHVRLYPPCDPFRSALSISAKIRGVNAPADERRLRIQIQKLRGQGRMLSLHVFLAANRRNALLVNHLNVLDKVLQERPNDPVPIRVGLPFEAPDSSQRGGARDDLSRAEWDERTAPDNLGGGDPDIAWVSSINRSGFENAPDPFEFWQQLAGHRAIEPGLLTLRTGRNPYPVAVPGVERTPTESLLEAFTLLEGAPETALDPDLEVRLDEARKRARRQVGSLERALAGSDDPAEIRGTADLLLARLTTVPRGVERATLEGFDGTSVEITLDPTRSPRENAEALYDRAGRAERARRDLPGRIEEAQTRLDALEEALEALARGEAPNPETVGPMLKTPPPTTHTGAPALPYRVFLSSGGLDIWVGRGAKSNDALTFQHARPNDVWLHARDTAGAHVVLRWSDEAAPPARDLDDAAVLAALFSKARHSGWVPVDWTRRKHVRKPRKAAAGTVIPARVKTVFVEPSAERAEAMAVRE